MVTQKKLRRIKEILKFSEKHNITIGEAEKRMKNNTSTTKRVDTE